MNNLSIHIWGICFRVLFWCAWLFFTVTRIRVRGAMVAVWHRNKVLLIQKSYRNAWSIPGGRVNRGESMAHAAVRETFEEVGLRINIDALAFVAEVPGDLGPRNPVHLFEVVLNHPLDLKPDQREIIRAEFVAPEAALARDLAPSVGAYLQACLTG